MHLERIDMPNADPIFVRTLAGIVRRALSVPSTA
jgi:protoheme ferro-lyase